MTSKETQEKINTLKKDIAQNNTKILLLKAENNNKNIEIAQLKETMKQEFSKEIEKLSKEASENYAKSKQTIR